MRRVRPFNTVYYQHKRLFVLVATGYATMRGVYGDMRGDPGFRQLAPGTGTKASGEAELKEGRRANQRHGGAISYPFLVGGVNGLTRG